MLLGISRKAGFARVEDIRKNKKLLEVYVNSMVATLSGKSGKTKKNYKSPEKLGENGGF